jgi:hypothetical protein
VGLLKNVCLRVTSCSTYVYICFSTISTPWNVKLYIISLKAERHGKNDVLVTKILTCRIWCSYSCRNECCHLLRYSAVQSVCEPTFRSNVDFHTDYTALFPRRWQHSEILTFQYFIAKGLQNSWSRFSIYVCSSALEYLIQFLCQKSKLIYELCPISMASSLPNTPKKLWNIICTLLSMNVTECRHFGPY